MKKLNDFFPGIGLTLFFLFFFPVFIFLGIWQLNRATEKDQLLENIASQESQLYTGQRAVEYSRWRIEGSWLSEPTFYMDNRTYQGQAGYEIWAPFESEFGVFLVSVGWLPVGGDRRALPEFQLPSFPVSISVVVRPDSMNPLYAEDTNEQSNERESRWLVQSLSVSWTQSLFEQPVYALAQLERPEEWGVGPRVWQPTVMSPDKHRSYAIQWFGMALALLCMFLYAAVHHKNNKEKRG